MENICIDKISFVADWSSCLGKRKVERLKGYLERGGLLKDFRIANYPYRYSFFLEGGGVIQVAGLDSPDNVKPLRFEFNPQKCGEIQQSIWEVVFLYASNIALTRVDVAIDYIGERISEYRWSYKRTVAGAVYYGRDGAIETIYIGSRQSDRVYRVYDKRREQLKNEGIDIGEECMRVEMRFRGRELPEDGFDGLYLIRSLKGEGRDRLILEALLFNPGLWVFLKRPTRKRYRLKLLEYVQEVLSPGEVYRREKEKLQQWLSVWLEPVKGLLSNIEYNPFTGMMEEVEVLEIESMEKYC